MVRNINIAKFASGSWPDNIGDTTLFYSAGYTRHASDVSGLFLDNPPVLSPKHASLVWRYNADVDKYILIHVQGSHVVSKALGRIYPFRAGYEVSRDDMNLIGFCLTSLFQVMPRIQRMPEGRVASDTAVNVGRPMPTNAAQVLADHIMLALIHGSPLYIALDIIGERFFGDGVFEGELQTLTAAIECLPMTLRRYASFGYCVDEHFCDVLDGVPIVVYDKASKMAVPQNAVKMTWEEATEKRAQVGKNEEDLLQRIQLPGEHGPLLVGDSVQRAFKVSVMTPEQLQGGDWTIWRMLGNDFAQLGTKGWREFKNYYGRMDEESRKAYIESVREASLGWTMEGFHEDVFNLMHFDGHSASKLQDKALPGYLYEGRHSFLFRKGLSEEQRERLDGRFLRALKLGDAQTVINWYGIFEKQGCTKNKGVMAAFGELFGTWVVPELKSMRKIVECMRKYPFIPTEYFQPPRQVSMPEGISSLKPAYREMIESWLHDAASAYTFGDVRAVTAAFGRMLASKDKDRSPESMALKQVREEELFELLSRGNENQRCDGCEDLLSVVRVLPRDWDDFVRETLLPAVQHTMFGGKRNEAYRPLLSKEQLLDVHEWPRIAAIRKNYPLVYKVVCERLITYFGQTAARGLGSDIKTHFINAASLKKEKKAPQDSSTTVRYKNNAEGAYPIISLYISTIKKSNTKMSKELDHLFRDLKGTHNWKRIRLVAWICTAIICALGGLAAGKFLFSSEKPSPTGGVSIVWEGNQQHNLMQQLAYVADWDSVSRVKVDSLEMAHLAFGKTADLLPLSKVYYKMNGIENVDTALVRAFTLNEKGEQGKTDTLVVTLEKPLLESVCDKKYRIQNVSVKDCSIDIPNTALMANDSLSQSTLDAKYYFAVVRYLTKKLPANLSIAY